MRYLIRFLALIGVATCAVVAIQFTVLPWRTYAWLSGGFQPVTEEPDVIVVLGGGGIPSESGLMRSYVAAAEARRFPNAMLAVAMTDSNDVSTIRMLDELVLRGVKRERLLLEDQGRNTREQAVNLYALLHADGVEPVTLVVTSADHVRRSLLSFQKAGFKNVSASAAVGEAIAAPLEYKGSELGATPAFNMDVGGSLTLRYYFWNNIGLTSRSVRELAALVYYKMMGWI